MSSNTSTNPITPTQRAQIERVRTELGRDAPLHTDEELLEMFNAAQALMSLSGFNPTPGRYSIREMDAAKSLISLAIREKTFAADSAYGSSPDAPQRQ